MVKHITLFSFFMMNTLFSRYANDSGFPFTKMVSSKTYVVLGNIKSVFRVVGTYYKVPFQETDDEYSFFSGGISDDNRAIFCNGEEALYFEKGRFSPIMAQKKKDPFGRLSCAMANNGEYAIYDKKESILSFSSGKSVKIPIKSRFSQLLFMDGRFYLFIKGSFYTFLNGALEKKEKSPFGLLYKFTRMTTNGKMLLKADDLGVFTATCVNGQCMEKKRLPVSPCEEHHACAVSLGIDNSWMVAGNFGVYHGMNSTFKRLRIANFAREYGGSAVSHEKSGGKYLYYSNDDGDMGTLPLLEMKSSILERHVSRFVIWSKVLENDLPLLFSLPPYYVHELTGEFPIIPRKTWVAWEKESEVAYETPRLSKRMEESNWWVSSLGYATINEILKPIKEKKVIIGVMDSGVVLEHPGIQNLWKNEEEVQDGIDNDGNGYIDDEFGYDFVDEDGYPTDRLGHGTHVAGLLSGKDNTLLRDSTLVVTRVLDANGKSNSIDLARAISYLADRHVDAINMSFGGGARTSVVNDAIMYAKNRHILMVTSAGNNRLNLDRYPQVPGHTGDVVSIASSNQKGKLSSFSNFGKESVLFLAPGSDIESTWLQDGYEVISGTSMASPIAVHVASTLLSIYKHDPRLSKEERVLRVLSNLCIHAKKRKKWVKCGEINPVSSVQQALKEVFYE